MRACARIRQSNAQHSKPCTQMVGCTAHMRASRVQGSSLASRRRPPPTPPPLTHVQQARHPGGRLLLQLDLHHGIREVDGVARRQGRAQVPAKCRGGQGARVSRRQRCRASGAARLLATCGDPSSGEQRGKRAPAERSATINQSTATATATSSNSHSRYTPALPHRHQSPGARGAPSSRSMRSSVSREMRTCTGGGWGEARRIMSVNL